MTIEKIKTTIICSLIIIPILLLITFFEFIILNLFGLQYQSIGALVVFFLIYLILEIPISLITNAIPPVLKELGMVPSSKGLLPFMLDSGLALTSVKLLDTFMESISITWLGAMLFAIVTGLVGMLVREKDEEPPMVDHV